MNDLSARALDGLPVQLLTGAGLRVDRNGVQSRIVLDYRNVQDIDQSDLGKRFLVVQDPDTGQFVRITLDLTLFLTAADKAPLDSPNFSGIPKIDDDPIATDGDVVELANTSRIGGRAPTPSGGNDTAAVQAFLDDRSSDLKDFGGQTYIIDGWPEGDARRVNMTGGYKRSPSDVARDFVRERGLDQGDGSLTQALAELLAAFGDPRNAGGPLIATLAFGGSDCLCKDGTETWCRAVSCPRGKTRAA